MDEILYAFDNNDSCEELIKKYSTKQLVSMLWKSTKSREDPSIFFNALLSGIKCEIKHQEEGRLELFMNGLQIILEGNITPDLCSKFVGVMLLEVERFSTSSLISIFNKLLSFGKSGDYSPGKWLDLIPRVISCLTPRKNISFRDSIVNGEQFTADTIELLLATTWPPKIVVNIAAIFNDIALTSDQLKDVLMGLLKKMNELPLDNIPPLVFQLHLLCTKGHKNIFLKELIRFFNDTEQKLLSNENVSSIEDDDVLPLETIKITQLRETEGTVLMHLLLAVKSDQDLGNEFVKWLKAHHLWPSNILASFTISLSFCFANILRFKTTIFETLKLAILQCFKESIARKSSFWMRELITRDFSISDVMESITKSTAGCDHVIQSLIEFGFYLLDSFSSISTQVKYSKEASSSKQMTCSLGCNIILNTFKNNRIPWVRDEIINSILKSIIPSDSNVNSHYMSLLKETIRISPQDYQQSISKICELFDYLVWLPTSVATELIFAVQPLIPLNLAMRDLVLLNLRKSMTHKEISARKIAVNGSLICLKHFRNSDQLRTSTQTSQCSISESQQLVNIHHSESNVPSSNVLSLDLVAMLRRCFSLPADLRIKLYMGFPYILKQNGFLVDTVLEMLLSQVNKVVEAGAIPPIRFKKCVQNQGMDIVYMEPLHLLLRCISNCLMIAKANYSSSGESQQLDDSINLFNHPLIAFLEDFRSALSKIEVESFELERLVEYTPTAISGSRNTFFAKLILGVYEALIEYTFFNDGLTSSMVEVIIDLFAKYKDLLGVIKKAPVQPKKKKEEVLGEKNEKLAITTEKQSNREHVFSAQFLISILKLLISDKIPDHQESAILLKRQTDFIGLIVAVIGEKIANILEFGCVEIDDEMNAEDPFSFCRSMGRLMLLRLAENENIQKSSNEISLDIKFLECLASIFNVVTSRYFENWEIFLKSLVFEMSIKRLDNVIYEQALEDVLKKLQRLVNDCLNDSNDKNKMKRLGILITILSHLIDNSEGLSNSQEFLDWIKNLCSLHSVDDSVIAKQIFNLYFKITNQYSSHLKSMLEATKDICSKIENLDETTGSKTKLNYSLITETTSVSVLLVVVQHLEAFISNLEWMISKLKVKNETANINENKLCYAIAKITACAFNLITCNLTPGQCVDAAIKLLSHFYLVLQELIKYLVMMYKDANYKLADNYIKLIEQINSKLTRQVYTFIESLTAEQAAEAISKKKTKTVKESVTLPTLIYNVEQFERFLIKLAKVSKMKKLITNMKCSTNRDFRIDSAQIDEIMEQDEVDQQNSEDEELNNSDPHPNVSQPRTNGTQGPPPLKRLKLTQLRGSKKKKM